MQSKCISNHSYSFYLLDTSIREYPCQNRKPTAARNAGIATGPHTKKGLVGNLSRKNPPNKGPKEFPIVAHKPRIPIFFPTSPGLDIFPMAEFAVGTNNISPITRITIEPTAGINDFTQLIDKNPTPYRTLPKNKALREPNQAIRLEIGY